MTCYLIIIPYVGSRLIKNPRAISYMINIPWGETLCAVAVACIFNFVAGPHLNEYMMEQLLPPLMFLDVIVLYYSMDDVLPPTSVFMVMVKVAHPYPYSTLVPMSPLP